MLKRDQAHVAELSPSCRSLRSSEVSVKSASRLSVFPECSREVGGQVEVQWSVTTGGPLTWCEPEDPLLPLRNSILGRESVG